MKRKQNTKTELRKGIFFIILLFNNYEEKKKRNINCYLIAYNVGRVNAFYLFSVLSLFLYFIVLYTL